MAISKVKKSLSLIVSAATLCVALVLLVPSLPMAGASCSQEECTGNAYICIECKTGVCPGGQFLFCPSSCTDAGGFCQEIFTSTGCTTGTGGLCNCPLPTNQWNDGPCT
jgi:hypothetical protein